MTIQQKSFSSDKVYNVTISDTTHRAIACDCGDYTFRGQHTRKPCPHMRAFEENRLANLRMMMQSY